MPYINLLELYSIHIKTGSPHQQKHQMQHTEESNSCRAHACPLSLLFTQHHPFTSISQEQKKMGAIRPLYRTLRHGQRS
jgi:hypothetical protein